MATAIVSLLSNRPVHRNIAMTGEITLRGEVLPVGGIKEKVLAAHRAGIRTIVLPRLNERDLEDINRELRRSIHFVVVDNVSEVLDAAIKTSTSGRKQGGPRAAQKASKKKARTTRRKPVPPPRGGKTRGGKK
jgi:ATP-dependent Lon protease